MKNKVTRIVKAKLSSKEGLPDWYEERRSKCFACPHNTANIENLSTKDKIRVAHNLGKPACILCTCGIDDKCSDPVEQCPDNPPRWFAQEVEKGDLNITKKSGNAEFYYNSNGKEFVIDYGIMRRGANTKMELSMEFSKGSSLLHINSSCGCTVAEVKDNIITITYRNHLVETINKKVTVYFKKDGKTEHMSIRLKGEIR